MSHSSDLSWDLRWSGSVPSMNFKIKPRPNSIFRCRSWQTSEFLIINCPEWWGRSLSILLPHRLLRINFLRFVCFFLLGTLFPAFEIEAYRPIEREDFPRYPNGEISAVIHPNLQVGKRRKEERAYVCVCVCARVSACECLCARAVCSFLAALCNIIEHWLPKTLDICPWVSCTSMIPLWTCAITLCQVALTAVFIFLGHLCILFEIRAIWPFFPVCNTALSWLVYLRRDFFCLSLPLDSLSFLHTFLTSSEAF